MSQTSFKITFTLGCCWAFTFLHSVYPLPPGFIFFTSPRPHHPRVSLFSYQHHHSSGLGPACQIQIYILEAECCWRKSHTCVYSTSISVGWCCPDSVLFTSPLPVLSTDVTWLALSKPFFLTPSLVSQQTTLVFYSISSLCPTPIPSL